MWCLFIFPNILGSNFISLPHRVSSQPMGEKRKGLQRETVVCPLKNYADVLVLNMLSWMPYLCLGIPAIHPILKPTYNWDSVSCLQLLCKSMQYTWEEYFSVQLHITIAALDDFLMAVPAELVTFLRTDDLHQQLLVYYPLALILYGNTFDMYYAVVTIPWKSFRILQQSEHFKKSHACSRYDWRHYWKDDIVSSRRSLPRLRDLVFQDVFHSTGSPPLLKKKNKYHPLDEFHEVIWETGGREFLQRLPRNSRNAKQLPLF